MLRMDHKTLLIAARLYQLASCDLIRHNRIVLVIATPLRSCIALEAFLAACELPEQLLAGVIAYAYGRGENAGSKPPSAIR